MLKILPDKTDIFSLDCAIVCPVHDYFAKPKSQSELIFKSFRKDVALFYQKGPRQDNLYMNWLHRFSRSVIFANMQDAKFEFVPNSIKRCFEQLSLLRAKRNEYSGPVKYPSKQIVLPMPLDETKWGMSVDEIDALMKYTLELAEPEFLLWLYE